MNKEGLQKELQNFYDNSNEIGVSIYAVLKNSNNLVRLDIEDSALNGLKSLFINSIKKTIIDKEEISILNLSTSDERTDAIYLYDMEIPDELKCINDVINTDDLPLMNTADIGLSEIKVLLIEIGNNETQIVLYKTITPINIYGRASFFLIKNKTRLTQIDNEFLRVTPNFQLMKIKNNIFVLDLKVLEQNFGFYEIIKREAKIGIDTIKTMLLVENIDVLYELIDDVRYARKFTKIAKSSPILKAKIPNKNIINFCKDFPILSGKIRFNSSEDKILLDTKVSKNLFIKVLMDDYLTSELTNLHYDSIAKDGLDE